MRDLRKTIRAALAARGLEAVLLGLGLIVAVIAVLAVGAAVERLQRTAETRFGETVDTIVLDIDRHYRGAATTLRAMQGFFAGSDDVTRDEFYRFVDTSRVRTVYPGFSTFAYVKRVPANDREAVIAEMRADTSVREEGYPDLTFLPEGDRDEYWPIVYVDPEPSLLSLLGVDQLAEPVRAENLRRARDAGDLAISDPITLLPEGRPGLIIAAPLYATPEVPDSVQGRRAAFDGAVTAALYLDEFLAASAPPEDLRRLGIGMSASQAAIPAGGAARSLVYTEPPRETGLASWLYGPVLEKRTLVFDGRTFDLAFTTTVETQLSDDEIFEPLAIGLFFAFFMLAAALALVLVRQARTTMELRRRYDLISTLSHQLRTPLNRMRWSLDILLEKRGGKEEEADVARDSLADLNAIINRLLLFLEFGNGYRVERNAVSVPVPDLVADALERIPPAHDRRRVRATNLAEVRVAVRVDKGKLALAISFLIDNALTYSEEGTPVIIDARRAGGGKAVEILIIDEGYGIPSEEQPMVFTEFFRASNASLGKNAGSGVSLAIAKSVIEGHGGTISFTSEEGRGTTFVVRLPIIANDAPR